MPLQTKWRKNYKRHKKGKNFHHKAAIQNFLLYRMTTMKQYIVRNSTISSGVHSQDTIRFEVIAMDMTNFKKKKPLLEFIHYIRRWNKKDEEKQNNKVYQSRYSLNRNS